MQNIYVTRNILQKGIQTLRDLGYSVDVNSNDRALTKQELVDILSHGQYDGVLCLLTDTIDTEVFDAAPSVKIYANYAVGVNNIDVAEAQRRGIVVTNTPISGEEVAEHAVALICALGKRIVEADRFVREGKFTGWDPLLLLGTDLSNKTVGIIGGGHIGAKTAHMLHHGFNMNVLYYDVKRNLNMEESLGATYFETVEEVLTQSDIVSLHVPLLDSTKHLINKERLGLMQPHAFLINTSRGPIVDEQALVHALKEKQIAGAGLDVFEHEPQLTSGLIDLPNVVLTPHTASATLGARLHMAELAVQNLKEFFEGKIPEHTVKI